MTCGRCSCTPAGWILQGCCPATHAAVCGFMHSLWCASGHGMLMARSVTLAARGARRAAVPSAAGAGRRSLQPSRWPRNALHGVRAIVTRCAPGCSALCKEDGSFAPAHVLADARLERAGRAAPPGGGLDRRRSEPGVGGGRAGATRTAALVRARGTRSLRAWQRARQGCRSPMAGSACRPAARWTCSALPGAYAADAGVWCMES